MALVPLKPVLDAARRGGYAQGAFNVNAVCQAKAVIEVHEMLRSAAILQGADLANAFMGGRADFANGTVEDKIVGARNIGDAVKKYGENSPVPVVLHLDHGRDMESVKAAIAGGYTSVMIDGSSLPLEENMELTREVVKYAHPRGVSVEGELGTIGDTGTSIEGGMTEVIYTDPDDAKKFVEETGVDTLAVAIGTCHGLYPKGVTPKLRMDVLKAIKEKVDLPLVLHGGSGNPDSEIAEAVEIGIQKVNISSDYKSAFFIKAREILSQEGSGWDPNNLFPECIEAGKAAGIAAPVAENDKRTNFIR